MNASPAPAAVRQSRTLLVTYLGAVVRKMGDWMPIAGTVELMEQLGLDESSVRTAVFRLKKREWLAPETRAGMRGYAITNDARDALTAGDEIIWHARRPAPLEDGWCVVNFSVPESARSQRHQLRAHLASLGFGNISNALWIAPARMQAAADRAISELGLTSNCAIFVGTYVGGQDLLTLVRESWALDSIDHDYRTFIDRHQPDADALADSATIDPEKAFLTYLRTVDEWRKLPFHDPGLPAELLGDGWSGPRATALFEQLVAILEGRALAHAAQYWR